MSPAALLLLADGRFPAGGHAHSGGVESACADGRVTGSASLAGFVEGRVRTQGLVDAALAVATMLVPEGSLALVDAEADARIGPPSLRAASRRLGRQLVRVGARCWPAPVLVALSGAVPDGAHQPVALGAVGVAAGLSPEDVAALSLHHAVTTPAQAAVRLRGLDPFGVAALTAGCAPLCAAVAADAVAAAHAAVEAADLGELPALASPLVDVAAVEHRAWDVRLFAT